MTSRGTVARSRSFINQWQRLSLFFLLISTTVSGQNEFITTWQATGNSITIPTQGGGYNYDISWEELGNPANAGSVTGVTGNYTITLPNTNQYRIKITGQFPRIYFNEGPEQNKILSVEQWGTIAWTDMSEAFAGCSNLTIPAADAPDLSGVLSLRNMFRKGSNLTVSHIDLWDVSRVEYMNGMFYSCHNFNGNIGNWDVSRVTNMSLMFRNALSFNQDISHWNVGSVTNMLEMFGNAVAFNQNIGTWDVSNVTNMGLMFRNAASFNQDISHWDVSNVTNMGGMFGNLPAFNQNIGSWDVSKVTDMNIMFQNAVAFNQDLGSWDITQVSNMTHMFSNSGLSKTNYHLTLAGWASKNVKTNVPLGAQGVEYDKNDVGRKTLRSKSWTITGDICTNCSFITTWQTTDGTITIPTTGGGYNYDIYWEEIGNPSINGSATGRTGTYTINGLNNTRQYRVKISGNFPRIHFNDGSEKNKIFTVEQWGDIAWTSMSEAFFGCSNLTVPAADAPDLSGVTSLKNMFRNATSLIVDHIDLWDVSHVIDMNFTFRGAASFNQATNNWNVANVTNMRGMFREATSFNQNIGNWDVSKVTNMSSMFQDATTFNQSLHNWDVSTATNMGLMFAGAASFDQDISNWNVGNVTNMGGMFSDATPFNQDIGSWDVSKVTDMNLMFQGATAFNRNLGNWDVTQVSTMANMLNNSGLSKENYRLTLAGWASKNVKTNVSLGAQGLEYDKNDAGRKALRSKSWNITGDICLNCSFITTWQATGNSITIPTTGGGYNYSIHWEEIGNEVNNNGNATATGNYTINTTNANQYRVEITGQFPRIYFNDGSEKNKILTVEQWGDIAWTNMTRAFFGCSNLTVPAVDAPNLSGVTSLADMFQNASSLTVDNISFWNVSGIQLMNGLFLNCKVFNGYIGGWDVSAVTNMGLMFDGATSFNQDIGGWNVGNVTNMGGMFRNATSFNHDIGNWDVSKVTDMNIMFQNATTFNRSLGNWDVSKVTNMSGMFQNAVSFDQNISGWHVGNVTNMYHMFMSATAFNQNIGNWDVNKVTDMGNMFQNATSFNQDIGNWDVGKVIYMDAMFENAVAFNQNLGIWNVTKVALMTNMFNNSALSRDNYELTLTGWASKNVLNNVTLGASGLKYCSETARNTLISTKNWTITGDAKLCTQTITFNALPAQVYGDIFTLSATASSGLPITYSSSDPSIASIVDNTVTVHATGNITITATQSGDASNEAANSEQQSLTINPKPVTVTATSGQTKTYGEADPVFTYSSAPALINGDVFSGSLSRTVGENAGTYSITQGTLTAGSNYVITFVSDDFTITPKAVTVTATSDQNKNYGDADPVFTYSSEPALMNGDVFSGSLSRTVGENVGTYSLSRGTLTAGSNYTITFTGDDFTITPKAITVTVTSGQHKNYGDVDPLFTYSSEPALLNGDNFTGSLARAAGENAGTYSINQNTLAAGSNYTITFAGDDFEILPKPITVTATPGQTKKYGEADPVFAYRADPTLINGDVFSGVLTREAGEMCGTYPINPGTLQAGPNYMISFVGADFHIAKLDQVITFDPLPKKIYGDDPFTIVAHASSSLPVSFISSDESVASISGNVVSLEGSGSVTITAIQEGNEIYNPQQISQTLEVSPVNVFIPNFFSPDGNGVNDTFLVHGADIDEIQLIIFDRLGKEVFRTTDVQVATQQGWDGKRQGEDQPAGTYSWVLKGKRKNGNPLSFQGKAYGQVVLMR